MRITLLFFGLVLLFGVRIAFAIVDAPSPQQPTFVPDEAIVKYKEGRSPEELRVLVEKRVGERKTIFGFLVLFWEDLQFRLQKKETTEDKLQRLEETDKKAGVISRERVFKDISDPTLKNTFLLKLKQGSDVLKVVELYKGIPEIEYAEPNYTVQILNENL